MIKLVLTCDVCNLDYPDRFPAEMSLPKVRGTASDSGWHTGRQGVGGLERDRRDLCVECKRIAAARIGEIREANRRETT